MSACVGVVPSFACICAQRVPSPHWARPVWPGTRQCAMTAARCQAAGRQHALPVDAGASRWVAESSSRAVSVTTNTNTVNRHLFHTNEHVQCTRTLWSPYYCDLLLLRTLRVHRICSILYYSNQELLPIAWTVDLDRNCIRQIKGALSVLRSISQQIKGFTVHAEHQNRQQSISTNNVSSPRMGLSFEDAR